MPSAPGRVCRTVRSAHGQRRQSANRVGAALFLVQVVGDHHRDSRSAPAASRRPWPEISQAARRGGTGAALGSTR